MGYFEVCPQCGSDDVLGNPKKGYARCEACGFESTAEEHLPPKNESVSYPEGLEPTTMPTYLAHVWQAFWKEQHPRVKSQLQKD